MGERREREGWRESCRRRNVTGEGTVRKGQAIRRGYEGSKEREDEMKGKKRKGRKHILR